MTAKTPAKSGGDTREGALALSKPHLAPSRSMAAKEAIIQAVNVLESENEDLRRQNTRILAELDHLKQENSQLRRDVDDSHMEKDDVAGKFTTLERDNKRLRHELENQIRALQNEKQKITIAERQLVDENEHFRKQVEQLKSQVLQKDNEVRVVNKDLDTLKREVDKTARVNLSDRDFEIMHELESLKTERKDLINDREELSKTNSKIRHELKNLEVQLDEKVAELKNENRRHSLLTKEFNSLLEENNHLKLQLRRRNQRHSIAMSSRDDSSLSTSRPDGGHVVRTPRKYNSSISLNTMTTITDDRLPLRDSSLNSRDSRLLSRETTQMTASTRGDSSSTFYAQPHSTARDLAAGSKKQARDYDRGSSDRTTSSSPDTLPSIPGSSRTGGTWKPWPNDTQEVGRVETRRYSVVMTQPSCNLACC